MKLEFLMCGNHTDAFLSQAAMYRLMLDSFGGDYHLARLVLCVGGDVHEPLPPRWRPYFERIDVVWADLGDEDRWLSSVAQSECVYRNIDPTADIVVICDADTLLLRPFPEEFLANMRDNPALSGCIAHYAPPMMDYRQSPPYRISGAGELWEILAAKLLGRAVATPYTYTLRHEPKSHLDSCPFYINLGFLAATPSLFRRYHQAYLEILPQVWEVIENDFGEQLTVPFATELTGLPVNALPIRYNFPNDPAAESLYPDETANIVNIHYLRTNIFDRHRIFADRDAFEDFLAMPLTGSNAIFRCAVLKLTVGRYPFC